MGAGVMRDAILFALGAEGSNYLVLARDVMANQSYGMRSIVTYFNASASLQSNARWDRLWDAK
jgi:hypothetical protein